MAGEMSRRVNSGRRTKSSSQPSSLASSRFPYRVVALLVGSHTETTPLSAKTVEPVSDFDVAPVMATAPSLIWNWTSLRLRVVVVEHADEIVAVTVDPASECKRYWKRET